MTQKSGYRTNRKTLGETRGLRHGGTPGRGYGPPAHGRAAGPRAFSLAQDARGRPVRPDQSGPLDLLAGG